MLAPRTPGEQLLRAVIHGRQRGKALIAATVFHLTFHSYYRPSVTSGCGWHGSTVDYIVRTVDRCSAIRCEEGR